MQIGRHLDGKQTIFSVDCLINTHNIHMIIIGLGGSVRDKQLASLIGYS